MNIEKSVHSVLFLLCVPKKAFFFQVRIFLEWLLWNDAFFYKTGKKNERENK